LKELKRLKGLKSIEEIEVVIGRKGDRHKGFISSPPGRGLGVGFQLKDTRNPLICSES
jgi:hypothetical protein